MDPDLAQNGEGRRHRDGGCSRGRGDGPTLGRAPANEADLLKAFETSEVFAYAAMIEKGTMASPHSKKGHDRGEEEEDSPCDSEHRTDPRTKSPHPRTG